MVLMSFQLKKEHIESRNSSPKRRSDGRTQYLTPAFDEVGLKVTVSLIESVKNGILSHICKNGVSFFLYLFLI